MLIGRAVLVSLMAAAYAPLGTVAAHATDVHCGLTITSDVRLSNDLVGCSGNGIVIGADNVTLDLNGHIIDGHSGMRVKGGSVQQFGVGILACQSIDFSEPGTSR